MKKSMLLGAAALAAIAWAPQADAGEVSFGGYYRFQVLNEDVSPVDLASPADQEREYWRHRLHLKMDMKVSEKTHAHVVMRPIENNVVEGAGSSTLESNIGANGASGTVNTIAAGPANATNAGNTDAQDRGLDIRQAWLETEMYGVGVKVGEMPIQLHDNILVNDDGDSSFGAIVLSKTFNNVTAVLADVRVSEGNTGGASAYNTTDDASDDDIDLYVLSLLGSMNAMKWQVTGAYLDAQDSSVLTATAGTGIASGPAGSTQNMVTQDTDNFWLAGSLNGAWNGIDWTTTLIWEDGYDNVNQSLGAEDEQLEGGGVMIALRLKGKASWGPWNAYGFWGSEDFDSITNRPNWSDLYANPGGTDLMHVALANNWAGAATLAAGGSSTLGAMNANDSGENTWGLGVGTTFTMGDWNITPQLDYVAVTEDSIDDDFVLPAAAAPLANAQARIEDAWGGGVRASTSIDTGTTFSLIGQMVDPDGGSNVQDNTMHSLVAELKMSF